MLICSKAASCLALHILATFKQHCHPQSPCSPVCHTLKFQIAGICSLQPKQSVTIGQCHEIHTALGISSLCNADGAHAQRVTFALVQVTTLLSKADEIAAEANQPAADLDNLREAASRQGASVKQAKEVRCRRLPVLLSLQKPVYFSCYKRRMHIGRLRLFDC